MAGRLTINTRAFCKVYNIKEEDFSKEYDGRYHEPLLWIEKNIARRYKEERKIPVYLAITDYNDYRQWVIDTYELSENK